MIHTNVSTLASHCLFFYHAVLNNVDISHSAYALTKTEFYIRNITPPIHLSQLGPRMLYYQIKHDPDARSRAMQNAAIKQIRAERHAAYKMGLTWVDYRKLVEMREANVAMA